MISRRDKLLNRHWEEKLYQQHRLKVKNAKHAVDDVSPSFYPHVAIKLKKLQLEKERLDRVENENMRLLRNLSAIMKSKRMEDLWLQSPPNFLRREKMFETTPPRPKTTPLHGGSHSQHLLPSRNHSNQSLPLRESARARRCPTCRAQPEQTETKIPEDRVPWQTRPKTWNYKIQEMQIKNEPSRNN